MKKQLDDQLKRARRKRAEYLMQRGKPYNTVHCCWNTMHEQADTLSRKLARCWRKFTKLRKTTAHLAKVYNELNINERSVKSMPFEQFALLMQSTATFHTAKPLLVRLESRYKLSQAVESAPNPSSWDYIDHLLKQVASPQRKESPRKAYSNREERKIASERKAAETPLQLPRYQVRIVLCAYMILGHPDAVISGQGDCETALVKSAGKFVQELELLIKILLNGPLHVSNEKSDHELVARRTFRLQLASFDSASCSFLNSFVVWKAKDARSLKEDLIRAACSLELSMIQTCKMTSEVVSGPLSYDVNSIQKQVSEDQKLLREKVLHLSGDAGIERKENALSDTRMKFFNAMENGSLLTPLATLILSPTPASPSFSGNSDEASNLTAAAPKQSSVVRSFFRDGANTMEVYSTASSNSISQSSGESLDMKNVMIVNEYVHGERLAFTDFPSSSSGYRSIMEMWKETMENAFWDGIVESVKQDKPNYSRVVELMREMRDEIYVMAPHSWRQEILEAIDLEILTQVLNSCKLDIDYMGKILESALITLQKLSAPAYEDELKKKHQQFVKELAQTCLASDISDNSYVIALINGLRFVLQQIQEFKQEISKANIKMLEPFLKGPEALYYLGKSFSNRYGHPSNALIALPLTVKWFSSVRGGKDGEWNEHKNSLSKLKRRHERSSSFLPSTTLRTGGSLLVKMSENQADVSSTSSATNNMETIDPNIECKGEEIDLLVRLGLIKLVSNIAGLTEGELPETMNLNLLRLRSLQSRIQKIIVIATSILVLRHTLLTEHMVITHGKHTFEQFQTTLRLSGLCC
ncbi:hypothetical protein Pfo_002290 [Paulownia fortunei]|nr:hypothetical protein Pfo_002290 [Paulownia fortunei]